MPDSKLYLPVIGAREWLCLPDLGVRRIKAKIDTGAQNACLHASKVEEFERNRRTYVRFNIHFKQHFRKTFVRAEAELLEYRVVRSSNGHTTRRPVIVTHVEVLGKSWPVEVTLADRSTMSCRMLLGRESIRGRFLVDVDRALIGGTLTPTNSSRSSRSTEASGTASDTKKKRLSGTDDSQRPTKTGTGKRKASRRKSDGDSTAATE
ncbi:MAG: ATP-dependent zinc protease [Rhodopirellula sp.]|nr:ATP-dependent zinc protease [Rhodopirellula sp.]